MNTFLFLCAAGSLFLLGCGNSDSNKSGAQATNAASSRGSLATAPVDYLNAAVKAEQSAIKTVDTSSLNKAIDQFNVEKGRYPKDLDELVAEKYVPQLPPVPYGYKLSYDAAAGRVAVVKQ